jgi:hypothetical protein
MSGVKEQNIRQTKVEKTVPEIVFLRCWFFQAFVLGYTNNRMLNLCISIRPTTCASQKTEACPGNEIMSSCICLCIAAASTPEW